VNDCTDAKTVTLWRPTGPEELALVEAADWREWPPRLPDQPIFYPVLNQKYATMIARDWNVKHSGRSIGSAMWITAEEMRQIHDESWPILERYAERGGGSVAAAA
jgi:hypothetical protein